MDALLAEPLDQLLAELAQRDPVTQHIGVFLEEPHEVAFGGIGVHAEQQVGR